MQINADFFRQSLICIEIIVIQQYFKNINQLEEIWCWDFFLIYFDWFVMHLLQKKKVDSSLIL